MTIKLIYLLLIYLGFSYVLCHPCEECNCKLDDGLDTSFKIDPLGLTGPKDDICKDG